MLSAEIHKDLTGYRAKVVGGLTGRSLACCAAAVLTGVVVGTYLTWVLGMPFESVSLFIYASTIPCWAAGFFEPCGMRLEAWLPLRVRHQENSHLAYPGARRMRRALADERGEHATSRAYRAFVRGRGVERWRPGRSGSRHVR